MIRYAQPVVDEADIAAVTAVLRTPDLTQGEGVPRFERCVAQYCGAAQAVAVNSATSALQLACVALGLKPGDRYWTTPISFVATANAARHCGAIVEFVDIEPVSRNLCVQALAARLELAERQGTLPAIVVPVHFGGRLCDMPRIGELARRYGFRVIEDAAHALGARDPGSAEPAGAARHSDCCIFSFHAIKLATSGEGGVLTTRDPELAARLRRLRSHGITHDPAQMSQAADGPWAYAQTELGFNYRMSDIQAALGMSQMQRAERFLARRRQLARRYDRLLAGLPLTRPSLSRAEEDAWHLYAIEVDPQRRLAVYERLHAQGIGVNVHYQPIYRQPYYRQQATAAACPAAEAYYAGALSLPLHAALADDDQDRVVEALHAALA